MRRSYVNQSDLENVLHSIFPTKYILRNTKKKSHIVSPHTGYYLELDFYIPELKLAFEFQDPHHYETTGYSGTPIPSVRQNDDTKLEIVENRGETLIIVPCWWDGTASSLQASIYFQRPDLFNERPQGVPISLEPPQGHFSSKYIPEIGELMLASNIYTVFDPYNWWLGEIYIGIRGCWNPVTAKVYSRNHSEISIPKSFREHLGGEFLDGIFWFGRSTMQQYTEVNPLNFTALMKYIAFDVVNSHPFESRYETCLNSVDKFNQLVTIAPVAKCKNLHHMNTFLNFICDGGGEGIVCREPTSLYQPGISESLKRIKKSGSQQYALVTEMSKNQYCATLSNGISFSAELLPVLSSQISVGDVVKVSFSYLYRGKPVEPVISLMDEEIQWESIIKGKNSLQAISPTTLPSSKQKMPFGHWTSSSDNIRVFFDGIAEKHNFDPLVADNWYTFSGDIVRSEQSGGSILTHYNGSFVKALLDVYPNIGLEPSRFATVTKHFWSIPENRRKFFDKIAQRLGFDPLIPENWYSFDKSEVNDEKGSSSVMGLYGGSVVKALIDTYPEVNFDKTKFANTATRSYNPTRRREILDAFASKSNFDPNIPESWYSINSNTMNNSKDLALLLRVCYSNSLMKALKDVYPHLRFDERKFESRKHWHWHKLANRKAFFDSFAAKNGFDPLNMDKWRSVRVLSLLQENGGRALMNHYSNSLMKALNEVYPSLKLDEKFGVKPKFFWAVADNRRIFFDKLASSRGYDPLLPSTWYNFSRKELISVKGGAAILGYFSNSLVNTLMYTYPDIGLDKERLESKNHN